MLYNYFLNRNFSKIIEFNSPNNQYYNMQVKFNLILWLILKMLFIFYFISIFNEIKFFYCFKTAIQTFTCLKNVMWISKKIKIK